MKQHSHIERSFNVSEIFTSDSGKLSLVLLEFSLSYTCVYGSGSGLDIWSSQNVE